jgi:hypothetical protein
MNASVVAIGALGGIVAGLLALAVRTRLGGRLPGSFGQGFVGFRRDGWPTGVQEDDDAHWTWPRAEPASPDRPWLRPRKALAPTGPQRGTR